MRRAVKWLRRGAFGLGIAVALAFGGFQALASPAAMADCPTTPPYMGSCVDKQDCQDMCDTVYEFSEGFCEYYPPAQQKCCICIEL